MTVASTEEGDYTWPNGHRLHAAKSRLAGKAKLRRIRYEAPA